MITLIDRYILRQFIPTFLFGIGAFMIIYVVVDLLEKLDTFLDRNLSAAIIAKYYMYALPDIIHLIVPIAMLLASLFTIGRLDTTHELTAIRSSGRSIRRIAAPLFAMGLIVSCTMIYFNGWVVPAANKERYAMDRKYLGRNLVGGQSNVFLRISPTLNLSMDYFDPITNIANTISIERFDTAAPVSVPVVTRTSSESFQLDSEKIRTVRITERIDAASMKYDPKKKVWVLINGIARNLTDPKSVQATGFKTQDVSYLPITPEKLNLSQQDVGELTVSELGNRIAQEQSGGRDVTKLLIDYFAVFAFPFSAFVIVLYGIPFTSTQRKTGAGVRIAITALVSALYLIFTEVSKSLSYSAILPPAITAWVANIVFLIIGIGNLIRVERG